MRRVWLFEIDGTAEQLLDSGGVAIKDADGEDVYVLTTDTNYWATEAYTYDGNTYSSVVVQNSFDGINLRRASDESGICAFADTSFEIHTTPSVIDLTGYICRVKLVVDDALISSYVFAVRRYETLYGKTRLYLTSLIEKYLDGDHPVRKQPRDIWPAGEKQTPRTDDYAIPQVFGDAFVPLRAVNTGTDRYYVLGPSANTYTVSKVRVPPEWNKSQDEWTVAEYSMNQSTDSDYKLLQAIIQDSDGDGIADANGIWEMGDLDMPCRFTSTEISATSGVSPADVIEQFLLDIGVPAAYIDTGAGSSFADAATQYATWGIEWDGGFYNYMSREARLSNLLNQCASYLVIADKIELYPREDTAEFSVDSSDTISDSFDYSPIWPSNSDGIHVEYVADLDTPQSVKTRLVVWSDPTKSNVEDVENPKSTVLDCSLIHDADIAQRLGVMLANRLLEKKNRVTFQLVPSSAHLALVPDQVVTINDSLYGTTRNILVSSVSIDADLLITVEAIQFTTGVITFDDMTPIAYAVPDDSNVLTWERLETLTGVDWDYVFGTNKPSDGADVTATALSETVTAEGTILLKDDAGTTKVGLTASGAGNDSVRLWLGDVYLNREIAPLRFTQGGEIFTSSNINIIDGGDIKLWANSTETGKILFFADGTDGGNDCEFELYANAGAILGQTPTLDLNFGDSSGMFNIVKLNSLNLSEDDVSTAVAVGDTRFKLDGDIVVMTDKDQAANWNDAKVSLIYEHATSTRQDAVVVFGVGTDATTEMDYWSIGADTSDSRKFKLSIGNTLGSDDILDIDDTKLITVYGELGLQAAVTFSDDAVFDGEVHMKEVASAPGNVSGYGQFYTKSDNLLYFLDGDGNEYTVDLTAVI